MSDKERGHRDTIELSEAVSLERGRLVSDRYRILGRLGEGAMGAVYEALDEHLEERVALKLLHPHLWSHRDFRALLRAEVRMARRVSHPNVCRVHDIGQHEEALFVTMELIRGSSLREMIAGGNTPQLAKKLDILIQLCSALSAAHRAGVLHRDVKPDNVLVAGERAVLTDFGVASLVEASAGKSFAGTPGYMAPDLVIGTAPDVSADVYSTAVVAYELFSGQLPFPIESIAECLAHAGRPFQYPVLHRGCAPANVREALDSLLRRALSPEPSERPSSVELLAEGLARAARGEVSTHIRMARGTADRRTTESDAATTRARVVTALSFDGDGDPDAAVLERIVIDWGGYPVRSELGRVSAVFGAPFSRGDDALRAARAGLDLIERFGGLGAIDTSRASFQHDGDGALLGLDEAFEHLESLMSKSGELGCSAECLRHLAGHFVAASRGQDHVGRSRFAVKPARGRARALDRLIGRDAELAALDAYVRTAFEQRRPVFVQLIGEPGVGKSRLQQELARRIAERREVDWLVGFGAPRSEAAPMMVLRSAEPMWYRSVQRYAPGGGDNAWAAAQAWLLSRCARRPVVFVIEDGQWADSATVKFARELARTARNEPIAVIFVSRRALEDCPATIELGPLKDGDSAHLVTRYAPGIEPSTVMAMTKRAAGNPMFLCELASHADDGGAIPETIEAAIQGRTDRLGVSTRSVLEQAAVLGEEFSVAQLHSLFEHPLELAEMEAQLTELVSVGLLVVSQNADDYHFASPLIREVAHAQLDPRQRADSHARAAHQLEQETEQRAGRSAALAHHWLASGDLDRARAAYRRAGRESLDLFAYADALAALEKAEQLTPETDRDAELLEMVGDALLQRDANAADARYRAAMEALEPTEFGRRAELLFKLGQTATGLADFSAAVLHLEAGLVLCTDGRVSVETNARLLAQLGWIVGYIQGENRRGLAACEQAVELLADSKDKPTLAQVLGRLGAIYMRAGRWRDQLDCNQRNLSIAKELGDRRGELVANVNLGVTYTSLGELDRALAHTFSGLEIAAREGHSNVLPVVRNNLAALLLDTGDLEATESQLSASIDHAAEAGELYILPEAYCTKARLALAKGDLPSAKTAAQSAVTHARESGSNVDLGISLRHLAAIIGRLGERDEASHLFHQAREGLGDADPFEHARTMVAEGRFLRSSESSADWRRGADLVAKGRAVLERLGAARDIECLEIEGDLR